MRHRELGRSGLSVSAVGLGCMGMSQSYGPLDDEESTRTVHPENRYVYAMKFRRAAASKFC